MILCRHHSRGNGGISHGPLRSTPLEREAERVPAPYPGFASSRAWNRDQDPGCDPNQPKRDHPSNREEVRGRPLERSE
eukprot:2707057-Heterocapsa_arctica.AAC.1